MDMTVAPLMLPVGNLTTFGSQLVSAFDIVNAKAPGTVNPEADSKYNLALAQRAQAFADRYGFEGPPQNSDATMGQAWSKYINSTFVPGIRRPFEEAAKRFLSSIPKVEDFKSEQLTIFHSKIGSNGVTFPDLVRSGLLTVDTTCSLVGYLAIMISSNHLSAQNMFVGSEIDRLLTATVSILAGFGAHDIIQTTSGWGWAAVVIGAAVGAAVFIGKELVIRRVQKNDEVAHQSIKLLQEIFADEWIYKQIRTAGEEYKARATAEV